MKKKTPPWFVIGALVLGLLGCIVLYEYMQGEKQRNADALAQQQKALQDQIDALKAQAAVPPPAAPVNTRNVLYATQPVEPGIKISSAFFEKKATPNDILPDAFTDQSDIVGFYAIRRIEKGDPLTPRNIGKSLPYLSQRISPGMRAISLPVFNADYNDTGGFVVDGDKVDLLFTTLTKDSADMVQTQFLLQNLPILFVPGSPIKTDKTDGITPVPPPGEPISITFEVTPEQAQALIFLQSVKNGRFSMILKYRGDHSEIKVKPFYAGDYQSVSDLKKIQSMSDRSQTRVDDLAKKIAAEEKAQSTQGTPNETPAPTPSSP